MLLNSKEHPNENSALSIFGANNLDSSTAKFYFDTSNNSTTVLDTSNNKALKLLDSNDATMKLDPTKSNN